MIGSVVQDVNHGANTLRISRLCVARNDRELSVLFLQDATHVGVIRHDTSSDESPLFVLVVGHAKEIVEVDCHVSAVKVTNANVSDAWSDLRSIVRDLRPQGSCDGGCHSCSSR